MSDDRLEAVSAVMETAVAAMEIDGLGFGDVRFDFYTESFDVTFQWQDHAVRLRFPTEKIAELETGNPFVIKRLRKQLESALSITDEE